MTNIHEIKNTLRHSIRQRIAALPECYLQDAGRQIARHIAALPVYRQASAVMAFAGTAAEIDTDPLLAMILADGKALALPLCTAPGVMEARLVHSLEDLRPGPFGIREPDPVRCPLLPTEDIGLLIVPCLSCDRAGRRLGHGGGYYDRYLAVYPGPAVLLCPERLLLDAVPQEPHDRSIWPVITEAGVLPGVF